MLQVIPPTTQASLMAGRVWQHSKSFIRLDYAALIVRGPRSSWQAGGGLDVIRITTGTVSSIISRLDYRWIGSEVK